MKYTFHLSSSSRVTQTTLRVTGTMYLYNCCVPKAFRYTHFLENTIKKDSRGGTNYNSTSHIKSKGYLAYYRLQLHCSEDSTR